MPEKSTLLEKLFGAWELVSFEQTAADGNVSYPLGADAVGSIYYLREGFVSVHIMQLKRDSKINPKNYAQDGLRYDQLGYLAYSGQFDLDEQNSVMVHHTEISLYPEWVGGSQLRLIKVNDNLLELSSDGPVGPGGSTFKLTWRKIKS